MDEKLYTSVEDIMPLVNQWKSDNEKIVFTNGCFDLIHLGHIDYLKEAKRHGNKLIVGINSDSSVSKLKGSHRPINDETTRLTVMASFYFVDAVILFSDDTPFSIISKILPDVLVKGGDWKVNEIIGSDVVIDHGGEVHSLSFTNGYSSTNIENKIILAYKNRTHENQ
jgi:D-glycero-beta-D-manno-heptose 1-phosphate adenylyltransferase